MARKDADLGRYEIIPIASMRGAFKTPGLRDVALTAPYFHDGSAQSLEDVVELYRLGGRYKKNLSPNMRKANLTEKEKAQLVQFLHALTSKNTGMD
jgi:cytochrome c peroxidase